ncbi:MAG: bifunctional folylpolyglutamate synthase/dihydrofolate synthase [Spirochaetes bacterium]|nr:bifunctional folylpolyglutamate synthase/dihydrofolate synthase [Spirochaetota bacterium]
MLTQFLQSLSNNESSTTHFTNYTPDTITAILKHLGNPHKKLQCIHVAGTNGKGSTTYMIAKILQTAGYTVGLYTSPHLIRYNERITINGREITNEEISHYSDIVETLCKNHKYNPTFFDAFTIIALLYFNNSVDIAVIETGLGGRLDSTNVIMPLASVITPISYDHMAILGTTLEQIAYQKAGIIKNGIPAISAPQKQEAMNVLNKEASRKQTKIYFVGNEISYSIKSTTPLIFDVACNHPIFGDNQKFNDIHCSLTGDFQAQNASVAIATTLLLKKYGWAIAPENIYHAMSSLYIPGRCELLCDNPVVLFDCAHNPQALDTTIKNIHHRYPNHNMTFCVSFMKDKDIHSMLTILRQYTSHPIFYFTLPDNRCYIPDNETSQQFSLYVYDSPSLLYNGIKKIIESNSIIICTGTFRLYSFVKDICKILQ